MAAFWLFFLSGRKINKYCLSIDPEDDPNNPNAQNPVVDNLYPQQQNLIEAQSAGSYPTLDVRHHQQHYLPHQPSLHRNHPTINYNTGSAITISAIGVNSSGPTPPYHVNPQRRVLRQSTLPSTLANNDPNLSGSGSNLEHYNSVNLTAPTSPHQMQKGPLYPTAYNSEDIINVETTDSQTQSQIQIAQPTAQTQQQQSQTVGQSITPTHHRLQVFSNYQMITGAISQIFLLQVRRQSTLPANPCQPPMYLSTSPNRGYSRSPERSPGEQRYPPFMRQTSFPCNLIEPGQAQGQQMHLGNSPPTTYPSPLHRGKLLPQTTNYQTNPPQSSNQPYEHQASQPSTEDVEYTPPSINKSRMMRQATLPNPDQHVKLLPTSPPKRQTSPQYRRSPEFMRQQTLPNPEAFNANSLTVHGPNSGSQKFLPISPRQKQNFLFPNVQNPRPFLSQQNVPAVGVSEPTPAAGEHYSSSQSVNIHHNRDHSKMIKVRSHSNEEYSITKAHHAESRRLLPEIPTVARSMSRSPSRLVRQDCLKESSSMVHPPDGHMRTFGEAKQQFHQFQNFTEEDDNRPEYVDYFGDSTSSFLESDEVQYEKTYNTGFSSEPRIIYNDGSDDGSYQPYSRPIVHSAENMLTHDQSYNFYNTDGNATNQQSLGPSLTASGGALPRTPLMHNRLRRRQSRDLQIAQDEFSQLQTAAAQNVDNMATTTTNLMTQENGGVAAITEEKSHERPKPEQMRSISEDSGAKSNVPKPTTRRSLSHPENETQVLMLFDSFAHRCTKLMFNLFSF